MDAYLNHDIENKAIFNEILPIFCKYRSNISDFKFSDSADLYEFISQEQITKLVNLFVSSDEITLAQVEEVAPKFVELINILNKDLYQQIEDIYTTIDKYVLEGESEAYYFFEEWAGMTPNQIIKHIYNSFAYEMKYDTVFLR